MSNNYLAQQKELVKQLEDSFANGFRKSTVVDIVEDYANDDQICLTSAVFVPKEIYNKIALNIISNLKEIEPQHYFYSPESMHITIKNIRTVNKPQLFTEDDVRKVNKLFKKIIPKFSTFDFIVEDVLIFPTSLSIMAYTNDVLQKLVLALDKGLQEIGVPDNKKYFSDSVFWGNITICRFIKNPGTQFINEAKKMRNLKIGKFKVEKINLVTCNAVCHPKSKRIITEYEL
ncbi:MAG: hypothetical protein ABIG60_01415 [Patescibacteria group bacterium]